MVTFGKSCIWTERRWQSQEKMREGCDRYKEGGTWSENINWVRREDTMMKEKEETKSNLLLPFLSVGRTWVLPVIGHDFPVIILGGTEQDITRLARTSFGLIVFFAASSGSFESLCRLKCLKYCHDDASCLSVSDSETSSLFLSFSPCHSLQLFWVGKACNMILRWFIILSSKGDLEEKRASSSIVTLLLLLPLSFHSHLLLHSLCCDPLSQSYVREKSQCNSLLFPFYSRKRWTDCPSFFLSFFPSRAFHRQ